MKGKSVKKTYGGFLMSQIRRLSGRVGERLLKVNLLREIIANLERENAPPVIASRRT